MALGQITKQLAAQALGNTIDNVMEKPAAPGQAEALGATIVGEIQAMQKALRDDQELLVLFNAGDQRLRVLEIYVPSWQVMVLTGVDPEKNVTRVISPIATIQLICKVMRVQPPAKPARIAVVTPKPKPE
jgi:hypothetical protein